jgi:uncharacterized damage-inducible protein DinB
MPVLNQLFAYNVWANSRQLEVCRTLSQQQFEQPLGNSFTSIRATLVHLLGAQWVWLERLSGRSPEGLPDICDFPTLEAIARQWEVIEDSFREHLSGLHEEQLRGRISYVNFQGETWTYPVWLVLLHVVNHQTYHRGQITTLLRQLGIQPPAIDLLILSDQSAIDPYLFTDAPLEGDATS